MTTSNEYVFRVTAVSSNGEGNPSPLSDPVLAVEKDRKESTRSVSTVDGSMDFSEYSDLTESEYDPELDGEITPRFITASVWILNSNIFSKYKLTYAAMYVLTIDLIILSLWF